MKKKVVTVFLVAFLIRLISLNQSLWLDEGTTAKVVSHYNYINIVTRFSPTDFHPPLYYLFMKAWTSIFGISEVALRMPSVIFSLIAGWFVYLIGSRLVSRQARDITGAMSTGMWAAIVFLFNPLIVYYSQEARMYMLCVLLLTATTYYFLHLMDIADTNVGEYKNIIYLFYFLVFSILSLLTFYGSGFFIAGMLIYLLYKKQYKFFIITCFVLSVTCLILAPLLIKQLINAKESLGVVANWSLVLGKASLKNLFLIPLKFTSGRISFEPKKVYYLLSGVWAVVVFGLTLIGGLKERRLLFLFIFPLFLGFIISFISPLLQYFRFLYLIPLLSLLMVLGVNKLHFRPTHYVLPITCFVFIFWSLTYLLNSQFHREDWRSLAKKVSSSPIYMILPSSDPFKYYSPTLQLRELRQIGKQEPKEREIVIIPYVVEVYGFDYRSALSKKYSLKKEEALRGLTYEVWKKD